MTAAPLSRHITVRLIALALLLTLVHSPGPVLAEPPSGRHLDHGQGAHLLDDGRPRPASPEVPAQARRGHFPAGALHVGTVRSWPAADESDPTDPRWYLKDFTLRGLSPHVEVWTASGADHVSDALQWPRGDCRNSTGRTTITDAQVAYLMQQFEDVIRPSQGAVFPDPRPADGKRALLPRLVPRVPASAYQGDGERVVLLVDNIRHPNFYDATQTGGSLGFVFRWFNVLTGRNVMTIQGTSWAWRLGADPLPTVEGSDPCTRIRRGPHSVEALVAHEYNHVIATSHGTSPVNGERLWITEGVADWAMELAGYVDPTGTNAGLSALSHVPCFFGALHGQGCDAGPENSLTVFPDTWVVAADYGAAATFMSYVHGLFGDDFMRDLLLRTDVRGLEKLRRLLATHGYEGGERDLLADWAAAIALDSVLDAGATLSGGAPRRFRLPGFAVPVNWAAPSTHARPGAPPNGSDFVRLRNSTDGWLSASAVESLEFDAPHHLPPAPVEWTIEPDGHGTGDAALASGTGDLIDRSIVIPITVPDDNPTLEVDVAFDLELGWDFAYVQVSADGGQTYTSLPSNLTTTRHEVGAHTPIVNNLPGYTGSSNGWVRDRFDLSAHGGRSVLLAFRTMTDEYVTRPGISIDNVRVGGTLVTDGTTLDGWRTITQVLPVPMDVVLQLVSYDSDLGGASVARIELAEDNSAAVDRTQLQSLIRPTADVVAALVTYVEPTEALGDAAPYVLRVNGWQQPGG